MEARLYVIPGSHPAMAARMMLERKGIAYKRKDLMPVVSKAALRVLGFPGTTVPALKLDGSRIQGSRQIARELDRLVPEPPLFPADPERRAAVEEAERFGDEELQAPIRRMLWWGFKHDKKPMASYAAGAKMGVPVNLAVATGGPLIAMAARFNEADDEHVRRDLEALPAMLRRIDDWIAAGVLGGDEPNAADFQIAPSIGLAMTLDDLRPAIENRPAGTLAKRLLPDYPGKMPPTFPAEWLAPLRKQPAGA
ncbi:MAG TPA: glutathione S-transferase N-terminal domain-containing protein [Solirubrobacterales bacterium]